MVSQNAPRSEAAAPHTGAGAVPALLRRLWIGPLCLLAGVVIGRAFLPGPAAPVWHEAARAPTVEPFPRGGHASFADACERVRGGVVSVRAVLPPAPGGDDGRLAGRTGGPHAPERPFEPTASRARDLSDGSGFVVNAEKGLVVTARHVVAGARGIAVDLPDLGTCLAETVGEDEITDVAVLRLVEPPHGLQALDLGRSEDVRAGDWIVAVGNPYGFSQTVTAGVVSFVGRHLRHSDLRVTNDFLQFSAPVHPGSSGCPIVDVNGTVVGLTTQAADAGQGISFAIPSRTLKWVLDAMDKSPDGRVHRGYLGIEFETRRGTDEQGRQLGGVQVRRVTPGEPAQRAGLLVDDVVLAVDGRRIADAGDLHECITRKPPGTAVRLVLQRGGSVQEPVEVVLRDTLEARTEVAKAPGVGQ